MSKSSRVLRVELELRPRFLRHYEIKDPYDFGKLVGILPQRYIYFVRFNEKKLVARLRAMRFRARPIWEILDDVRLLEGDVWTTLNYLRQELAMKNTRRFLEPLGIKLGGDRKGAEAKYFKPGVAHQIIQEAREPYRTIFALVWATGLRAGEVSGLRVVDLDFDRKLIHPRTQADDRTRELRGLKTSKSTDPIPMTDETVARLQDYLKNHCQDNPRGFLFPNRRGRPSKRANVVKFRLWPILKRLDTRLTGLVCTRSDTGWGRPWPINGSLQGWCKAYCATPISRRP
jgi:integrase